MEGDQNILREILRLTRENNEMLHSMRRKAFLWGFIKFIIYALLFAAPIWFYMTYVSSSVDQMINTMNRLEGIAPEARSRFSGFEDVVNQFRNHMPAFMQGETATTSQQ